MADNDDKTEAPSEHRLRQAREEGQVVFSREAMSFSCLLGGAFSIFLVLPALAPPFIASMRALMEHAGDIVATPAGMRRAVEQSVASGLMLAVPLCGLVGALMLVAGWLQTGFLVHPESLLPKFSRISPISGIGRIFGGGTLPETLKSMVKFGIFAAILWQFSHGIVSEARSMTGTSPGVMIATMSRLGLGAASRMIVAQLVIAGFDILWMRYRHFSKLRMSRQELKEEFRNTEGDPLIKSRLKALRAKLSRKRMMNAVKTATVVVTNPTHYAVALAYEKGVHNAPRIVAKGEDEIAARIREIAEENRVPIVRNPPLARALYPLPLESEIPAEHFRVVAAIIAYVWKLKKPGSRAGSPR